MDEKCAMCQFIDADFGPVPACYIRECKNHSMFKSRYSISEMGLHLIREYIIENIMRNENIMCNEDCRNNIDLVEVIASLYEVLHRVVLNEPYEYMFHWANKTSGESDLNDHYFIGGDKDV